VVIKPPSCGFLAICVRIVEIYMQIFSSLPFAPFDRLQSNPAVMSANQGSITAQRFGGRWPVLKEVADLATQA
jgi:hypothetical protein